MGFSNVTMKKVAYYYWEFDRGTIISVNSNYPAAIQFYEADR